MIRNVCEDNEGVAVQVFFQPMPHVPNVILSTTLKRLLIPNNTPKGTPPVRHFQKVPF